MKYTLLLFLLLLLAAPSSALTSSELDTLTDTVMDYEDQLPFYSFLRHLVKKETNPVHLEYLAGLYISSFSLNKYVVVGEIITIQGILVADTIINEKNQ